MKIVCEACQAKYSIADEKVRGKVFKIRCKKCSHVIVVRGSGDGGAVNEFASSPPSGSSSPSLAPDLALDAGWHIVVEGEQVGPLSEGDIRGRLARGEITPETYIWKEGLPDWVKISSLAEFKSDADAPAEAASPFTASEEGGPFAGAATMITSSPPADVLAAAPRAAAAAPVPDLFASPVAASPAALGGGASAGAGGGYGGGYDPAPAADPYAPAPAMAAMGNGNGNSMATGGMTGQRHENSVLFSLSNLEALAKPSGAPLPAARGGAAAPSTSTTTEGSGLIDIRAMANMTLGAAAARNENKGSDLPAFSAPQFSPVAPVLLSPSAGSGTPRWAIAVLGFLGLVAVALTFVVIKLFSGTATPPVVAVAPPAAPAAGPPAGSAAPAAGTAPATAEKPTPPATPPPAANEDLPPREPSKAAAAGEPASPSRSRPAAGSRRSASRSEGSERPSAVTPSPRASAAAEAPRKPRDDIDSLLDQAVGRRSAPAASGGSERRAAAAAEEEARPAEKLPALSPQDVVKGMSSVTPRARECFNQYKVPGLYMVKVTVGPTGRVSNAAVTGKFAGTPSGGCVESAVKTAKFPPNSGLTFDYPVKL